MTFVFDMTKQRMVTFELQLMSPLQLALILKSRIQTFRNMFIFYVNLEFEMFERWFRSSWFCFTETLKENFLRRTQKKKKKNILLMCLDTPLPHIYKRINSF